MERERERGEKKQKKEINLFGKFKQVFLKEGRRVSLIKGPGVHRGCCGVLAGKLSRHQLAGEDSLSGCF